MAPITSAPPFVALVKVLEKKPPYSSQISSSISVFPQNRFSPLCLSVSASASHTVAESMYLVAISAGSVTPLAASSKHFSFVSFPRASIRASASGQIQFSQASVARLACPACGSPCCRRCKWTHRDWGPHFPMLGFCGLYC